jgi:hypothetical protein
MNWLTLNEYYMTSPDELEIGQKVAVKVVASVGSWRNHDGIPGDWAAYCGPSDWSDEEVARAGDKIDRQAAEALFPTLRDGCGHYRS